MTSIIYFLPDVNDGLAYREVTEDVREHEPGPDFVPAKFVSLVCDGVDPETAAYLADDGLRVCNDPPGVADDDDLVWIWSGMYEEAF